MSYVTLEVKIEHGRITAHEPEKLPENGAGILTILQNQNKNQSEPRPFGLAKGEFIVPDDFNEPLPEGVLQDFEGR